MSYDNAYPVSYEYSGGYPDPWLYQAVGYAGPTLPSPRSMFRALGVTLLVISTCLLSYLEESGTGFATLMARTSQGLVGVIGVCLVAGMGSTGSRLVFPAEFVLFSLFYLWCLAMVPFSLNAEHTRIQVISQFKLLLMALVMLNLVNGRYVFRWFLIAMVLAVVLMSFGAMTGLARGAELIASQGKQLVRQGGVFGNANEAGRMACLGAWAAACLLLTGPPKWARLFLFGAVIWSFLVIGMTGSKQALLALFIGAAITYWSVVRRTTEGVTGKASWLIVFAVLMVGGAVFVSRTALADRLEKFMTTVTTGTGDRSDASRRAFLERSFEVWMQNPVTGVGIGSVGILITRGGYRSPHNTIFAIGADTGIPGWLLFFGAWLAVMLRLRRIKRLPVPLFDYRLALMGWVMLSMFALWLFTGEIEKFKPFWVCFAGLTGYLVWVERGCREQQGYE